MKLLSKWCFVLAAVLTTAAGMAQTSSAIDGQFSALDHSLNGAADRLLMTANPTPGSDQDARLAGTLQKPRPSATSIESLRWSELRIQIEPILKAQGLPLEVLAVVKVESGGQLDALSPAGARGLWQLMPDTARRYGLIVSESKDERLDLEKATWAATQYLRNLHELFGDWRLALAAYNAGEEAVTRAIARSGSREFDVLSLKRAIPEETRRYVPAVLAQMRVMSNSQHSQILRLTGRSNNSMVYASLGFGD
jgi:hypothetical protein